MPRKKKGGRPHTGRTSHLHVSCKPKFKKLIKNLGEGNMSLGLEKLVERFISMELGEKNEKKIKSQSIEGQNN